MKLIDERITEKMNIHKNLASGRWFELTLIEQLANIGMDIERCIKWKRQGESNHSLAAFDRALDLLYLTVEDPKNRYRLREILRTREALIDHFIFDNEYNTTEQEWQNYFYHFAYAAALAKGR